MLCYPASYVAANGHGGIFTQPGKIVQFYSMYMYCISYSFLIVVASSFWSTMGVFCVVL